MATPAQILAENAQTHPAQWLPDFLRALAAEEEQVRERFLALVQQFQHTRCEIAQRTDFFCSSDDPVLKPMLDVIVEMAAEMQVDIHTVTCDCEACVDDASPPLLVPGRCRAAHDLRAVATILTSAP